ncbi:3-coathanger stack domain-containing protein, partial [Lacihabitans soyangensis]
VSASFSNAAMLETPAVPTITSTASSCAADEISSIGNYDGTVSYTFSPAGPSVGVTGEISGMTLGTSYTVTATKGSCTSVASAIFSNDMMLQTPSISLVASASILNCNVPSVTITASGSGSYLWNTGETTNSIIVDTAGTYIATLSTGFGCSISDTIVISKEDSLSLLVVNPPVSSSVDITDIALRTGSIMPAATVITYHTDAAGTIPLANPNAVTIPGTYYIKATTPGGCVQIKPLIVVVVSSPCPNEIVLRNPADNINGTETKKAAVLINASNKLSPTSKVTYQAGGSVTLNPGFETSSGSVFKAEIKGCDN